MDVVYCLHASRVGHARFFFSHRRGAGILLAMSQTATPPLQTEVQVMFFDTDCAAVVHNIAYLRFIEVARTLLAEQLGLGLVRMAETGAYPVVVRTEIDYRKPARLGDKLVVH